MIALRLEKSRQIKFNLSNEKNKIELKSIIQFSTTPSVLTEYSPPLVQFPKISKVS